MACRSPSTDETSRRSNRCGTKSCACHERSAQAASPSDTYVAERLGFRYFDDEVITLASRKAGIDPAVVAKAEQHTSFLTRLMDALATTPMQVESMLPLGEAAAYYSAQIQPSVTLPQEELRRLIQAAIVEIADRGDAVIVAHAASVVLARRKDVLRVLVTASEKTRRERLWLDSKLLNEDEAAKAVVESDRERALYLDRFFDLPGRVADALRSRDQHRRAPDRPGGRCGRRRRARLTAQRFTNCIMNSG
jgi:hypothetical protein